MGFNVPDGWLRRPAQTASRASLAALLPEGVSAILRPHFRAGLAAYAQRDKAIILSAYGAGCLLLCDLLSQNKGLPGWREAGFKALGMLTSSVALEDSIEEPDLICAFCAAEDLTQLARERGDCREICRMLDAAVEEMSAPRTALRGAVALRAAMARLEALALSVQALGQSKTKSKTISLAA